MIANRLTQIKTALTQHHLTAALITSVSTVTYLTNFSGFSHEEREVYLFITPNKGYILTDGRYSTAVRKHIANFELIEVGTTLPLNEAIHRLITKYVVQNLGIEENNLTVQEYKTIQPLVKKLTHFTASSLRIKKNIFEIEAIEKASMLGDKAFDYIGKLIKPGMTEHEVAWELEKYVRELGAELAFKTIIAFNANAAVPHHQTGETILTNNSLILIDMGLRVDKYCSDMTRTIFYGKASDEQKKIYKIVQVAQQKAIEHFTSLAIKQSQPITGKQLDQAARSYIISQGYPSIPHALGHGIGLEVHEAPSLSPNSTQQLEEGMVFSIEPGIYIPDVGGVRIEDLFAIQNNQLRQLTNASKSLLEL